MSPIQWEDFERVEMRVARVTKATAYEAARKPSYLLRLDFGPELGTLQSIAALGETYSAEELEGRTVVAVTNFPPKQIGTHMSHALVLAAVGRSGELRLLAPDGEIELGARIR